MRRVDRAIGIVTAVAVTMLIVLVGGAGPASAEVPAGDTESVVTGVEPPTPTVAIRVLGGDETIRLDVVPGHEVVVLGYGGEPYLRVDADGQVLENQRSPAVAANADRFNSAGASAATDPTAEPDWRVVGSGGSYEWHDHRMHWMAESVPVPGEPGDLVFGWTVDLVVDGAPVTVTGELRRGEAVTAWPYLVGAAITAGLILALGRRHPVGAAAAAAAAVSAIAVALTIGERVALECWTCGRLLDLVPVAIAVVAVGVAAAARRSTARAAAAAVALISLTGWLLVHVAVITEPVVVSSFPPALARGAVAVALGATVAGLGLAGWWGRRALDEYASTPPSQRGRRGRRRARSAATPAATSGTSGNRQAGVPAGGRDPAG